MMPPKIWKGRLESLRSKSPSLREREDDMKAKAGFMATMMERWMKMSQRMAGAIDENQVKSFSAAPDATDEINGLFEEWLTIVEQEILEILTKEKSLTPSGIAAKLKISEKSVNFFMDKMRKEGKLETA